MDADVVIVGAGIIGLASAYKLAEAGRSVLLVDRKGMAEETSRGNAGAFAFSDIMPLATKDVLRKLPRWVSDPLGPLTVRPEYLAQITPWMLRFWRAGWPDRVAAGIKAQAALMRVARHAAPYFNHQINGKWCWTRANEAGFPGWASDDIANGYESPEEAVDGWASSDGHAHQMRGDFKMNGQWQNYHFNRIGVGISGRKYIAVFGHSDEKL